MCKTITCSTRQTHWSLHHVFLKTKKQNTYSASQLCSKWYGICGIFNVMAQRWQDLARFVMRFHVKACRRSHRNFPVCWEKRQTMSNNVKHILQVGSSKTISNSFQEHHPEKKWSQQSRESNIWAWLKHEECIYIYIIHTVYVYTLYVYYISIYIYY